MDRLRLPRAGYSVASYETKHVGPQKGGRSESCILVSSPPSGWCWPATGRCLAGLGHSSICCSPSRALGASHRCSPGHLAACACLALGSVQSHANAMRVSVLAGGVSGGRSVPVKPLGCCVGRRKLHHPNGSRCSPRHHSARDHRHNRASLRWCSSHCTLTAPALGSTPCVCGLTLRCTGTATAACGRFRAPVGSNV